MTCTLPPLPRQFIGASHQEECNWQGTWQVKETSAYMVLVEQPEGNKPVVKPCCRQEDNIKMNLKVTGSDKVVWIHLSQDGTSVGLPCNTRQ
jgi:hypothetical protein